MINTSDQSLTLSPCLPLEEKTVFPKILVIYFLVDDIQYISSL